MKHQTAIYRTLGVVEIVFLILAIIALALILSSCALPTVTPAAVTPAETSQPEPSTTPLPHCTVATGVEEGNLNLRTGPGTQYAVIETLTEKTVLQVLAFGDWLKVTNGNLTGYVNSTYCKSGE